MVHETFPWRDDGGKVYLKLVLSCKNFLLEKTLQVKILYPKSPYKKNQISKSNKLIIPKREVCFVANQHFWTCGNLTFLSTA